MTTPSTGELLVKEAKSAERLEIMAMAEKAKTIEDFRKALEERHNASKLEKRRVPPARLTRRFHPGPAR